jgi:Arc-like DNA binding domain
MAKSKRALGAGRKPKGELNRLDSPFSLRMRSDLRKQLEQAAERSGRSLSQEMLHRVQLSFSRERDRTIDPSIRALSFLMSNIQREFLSRMFFLNNVWAPGRHWRTDPFFYKAFKFAVQTLLDKLEPIGNDNLVTDKTPWEVGSEVAYNIWWKLHSPQEFESVTKEVFDEFKGRHGDNPAWRESLELFQQEHEHILYGLSDARRDLQLNTGGSVPPDQNLVRR